MIAPQHAVCYIADNMAGKSVNKVILLGHLGKDAETKFTPSGSSVTNFTLATNRRVKDQQSGEWRDETDWHRVVLWQSENIANYLLKGKQVYLEGRLQTRMWEDKEGKKNYTTEVVCQSNDIILLASGRGGGEGSAGGDYSHSQQPVSMPRSARSQPQAQNAAPAEDPGFSQGITDDDVPF
jgi:single-strand DNA-binding protein